MTEDSSSEEGSVEEVAKALGKRWCLYWVLKDNSENTYYVSGILNYEDKRVSL